MMILGIIQTDDDDDLGLYKLDSFKKKNIPWLGH